MFYGRFKMIFVYQIPIRMYACLKDITYYMKCHCTLIDHGFYNSGVQALA